MRGAAAGEPSAVRQERDELGALYRLTDRLYRARQLADVYDAALDAITETLGDRASILLFDQDGVMRFVAARGLSDGYRRALEGHTPWKPGDTDPQPIFVADIDETDEPEAVKATIRQEGIRGLAFIPLVVHHGTVGKFMTYYGEPHRFEEREKELAVTIARQVGFSLERDRAETLRHEALQDALGSEERFRLMSEGAPVMIWQSGPDGHCMHLNSMLRTFWNVAEQDVPSFDWSTTIHPEDAPEIARRMIDAIAARSSVVTVGRYRRWDGVYRILETEARPLFSARGEFRGMIGVNVDVTEREEAERAVRESAMRFRELADTMPQLVWTADADGRLDYWNSRIGMFIADPYGADGRPRWEALVHPDDTAATAAAWYEARANASQYQFTHRLRMADGSYRWHLSRATPVMDAAGEVARWYGTATDVHELWLAEERLRESEQRQRLAVQAAGLGVFEWNLEDERAVWENARIYEIFGRAEAEGPLTHRAFMDGTILPEDRDPFRDAVAAAVAGGGDFRIACRIHRAADDTTRWVEFVGKIENDPARRADRLIGVVADITEAKQAEQHQRLLVNELNHRVKNTLAIVQSLAQQSFRGAGAPADLAATFQKRLAAIAVAHDLLTRSNWEQTSLQELIGATTATAVPARERVRLDGPEAWISPKAAVTLGMAIHELCTNAVKYGALTNGSGMIDIEWSLGDDDRQFELVWRESGGPPVTAPTRRGFGSRMIEQALAQEFGGRVEIDYRMDGLVCRLEGRLPTSGARLS